ncbi:hypothetical protein GCM10022206_24350 [Streptomyces chiangmaiensis]
MGWEGRPGVTSASQGISEEELVGKTGLTADQIQRAVMWQNAEAQRWIEQFGQNRGDGWDTGR